MNLSTEEPHRQGLFRWGVLVPMAGYFCSWPIPQDRLRLESCRLQNDRVNRDQFFGHTEQSHFFTSAKGGAVDAP